MTCPWLSKPPAVMNRLATTAADPVFLLRAPVAPSWRRRHGRFQQIVVRSWPHKPLGDIDQADATPWRLQPLCEAPRRSCLLPHLWSRCRSKSISSLRGQSPPSRIFRETSDAHAPPRLASRRHRVQFGNSRPQRLCQRRQAPGRRRAAPSQSHAYPPAQADRPAPEGSTAPRPPTWPKAARRASLQTCPQSEPRPPGPSPPRQTPRASYPCQEPLTASAARRQIPTTAAPPARTGEATPIGPPRMPPSRELATRPRVLRSRHK